MAETQTLEQKQIQRRDEIDMNRELGVVGYKSGDKQSDRVYEVEEGYKYLPGGVRLGPGQRFRPTERQIANGSLKGKAREITRSEYESVRRHERKPMSTGADFGEMERRANLLAFEMADSTREYALDSGLTANDFDGVEAEGANGRFTRAQVEAMVEARESADA